MQFRNGLPRGVPLSADTLPLIQVTGEGRLEIAPDTAVVALGFTVRAPQAAEAFRRTAAALNQVVQALVGGGIPRDQIQTQQVSLNPVYEEGRLVGYEGSSVLQVTLRDLAAIGPVIDRAVAAGANNVQGISFEVRDRTTFEAGALTLAVQDANRQAAVLAQSLGVALGPVWRVETEPAQGPIIPLAARAVALEGIPILPGTLQVIRRVRVEYILGRP